MKARDYLWFLAQELLDHYAAALYAADSDFSDLPEQEEACVLVME